MRFLLDEMMDPRIADEIVAAGHDVAEVRLGFADSADIDVAAMALADERIVITADRDFGDLVFRDGQRMRGIIYMRMAGRPYEERAKRILMAITQFGDRLASSIVVVEPGKFRIRPLLRLV